MAKKPRVYLGLSAGTVDIWRQAALSLEPKPKKIVSGPMKGQGNITELLTHVASGAVTMEQLSKALDEARDTLARVESQRESQG